ncbi:MAG: hypothetical protein WKF90_16625 [Pyrinomonadaceae bacterium]
MKNRVEVSLNNEPEYDFEYFDYPARVDDDAFEFFSDYGRSLPMIWQSM